MRKLFAVILFCITALMSVSGFCATREEMEETFFRTWNTKLLGIDDVMTPFGIFAVRKDLNRYENVFIFNNFTIYDNQPEDEYVYYGVLHHKKTPIITQAGNPSFYLMAARVDKDGYVINASDETPILYSIFDIIKGSGQHEGQYGIMAYNIVIQYDKTGDKFKKIDNSQRMVGTLYKDSAAEQISHKFYSEIKSDKINPNN